MTETIITGNHGEKIRSDCQVSLSILSSGGIHTEVYSKVKALYGKSIEKLLVDILNFYEIEHASIRIDDSGALPFVIAARTEAAIKQIINQGKDYLLPMEDFSKYAAQKERFRFSRLYLPGNTPAMMLNAGIHHPDGIILDLEDSVAPERKFEAAFLVRNALRSLNFYGAERMVRINQFPSGIEDLKYIVPHNVHVVLLPKCEDPEQVLKVEEETDNLREQFSIQSEIYYMPIIESALGVERAFDIAGSSKNVIALAIGLEDYTADIGVQRTQDASESFYARSRIVNACKASDIQAIDSVYSDVGDEAGLRETVKRSKSMGFEGMGCIHPRQIGPIHESFAPGLEEIEKAEKIIHAFLTAIEKGLGVVSLGTKMIDPPVVKRAQKIIDLALKLQMIDTKWRGKYVGETN
jgi:citrate lyase subunit beta/citryl-CoA lyase